MPPAGGRSVRYHLRVTITPQNVAAQADALYRVVREGRIDEVLFFLPHAEEMSPGLGTDVECRAALERVRPMFDALRTMGVAPSVNIWWTKSFSPFGLAARDLRGRFDFRWAVGAAGQSDYASACPIDERWLHEAKRLYATFAELKPRVIWLDDDVQTKLRGRIRGECYCPACLERAAAYTGRPLDRPELIRAILADPHNPVREGWLRFQREIMLHTVTALREAVHAVSPETRMGVMHSGMELHFAEGRRWAEHMQAACGPHRILCRPTFGNYSQGTPESMIQGLNATRFAQAVAGPEDELAPEVENYPQTGFNKSHGLVEAQLLVGQLLGLPEITLSIFRFAGRMDLDVLPGQLCPRLSRAKPRLQAIADLGLAREQQRGVRLFWHERSASVARGCQGGEPLSALPRRRPWDETLARMGFATCYQASPTSDVTVFSGEAIACLSHSDREALLSKGALLDARAAATLIDLGEGEMIGLAKALEPVDSVLESIDDASFGRRVGDTMNTRSEGGKAAQFRLLKGTRVISTLHTYALQPSGHGMTLFTNPRGGRVAVWPFDGQYIGGLQPAGAEAPGFSPSFTRQAQFYDLLTWLAGAPPDLFVPGAPNVLPLLSVQPGRLIAAVGNFHSDPTENVTLELRAPAFPVGRVRALDAKGKWRPCRARIDATANGAVRVETGTALDHLEIGVFEVTEAG